APINNLANSLNKQCFMIKQPIRTSASLVEQLVAVSFGLLCILQVILNISLLLLNDTNITTFHCIILQCLSRVIGEQVCSSCNESRGMCEKRGRDFIDLHIEGTAGGRKGEWQWVDGTPLTTSYWGPGEPNDFEGKTEDCVEIKFHDNKNSWNDIPCDDLNFWICEKKVTL
uniref:C-type lectin domain-containing protein n=1 Tax=Acanthochromis polyacanthus TaxID=80966 RepID=A0A3Q1GUW1_9TELE